jgi:hypothetical protein
MSDLVFRLNWPAIIAATIVYFALGGLWYALPVFGRRWEAGVGFDRPEGWRRGVKSYIALLLACFVASLATAILARALDAHSAIEGLILGLVIGIGYGAAIAGTDAMSPTNARPLTVAAIVGGYHVVGLTIVAVLLSMWG